MEFDDFVTIPVRIYPDCEKHCVLVEAEYTAEAKYVWQLDKFEKRRVLGGLECVKESDYAVKLKFKTAKAVVSIREYSLSEVEWAIVKSNQIDNPERIFKCYEDSMDLIVVKIVGDARLACDMIRKPIHEDSRVKSFLKDWQAMRSWPCYDLDRIGAGMICHLNQGHVGVEDGQVRLFKTNGRLLYALIMPWTKRKKLFIPLSRYNHPATEDEMWTEYFLDHKDDAMFRAVYMFWNTQIVDIKTAVWSWNAYTISEQEFDLVIKTLNHVYDKDVQLPVEASPRVGAPMSSWNDYNRLHPRAVEALVHHKTEALAELVNDFVFTPKSAIRNNERQIVNIRLKQMMHRDDQPELFAEE